MFEIVFWVFVGFLIFSDRSIYIDGNTFFGEFGGFDDDESDISLLYVLFGVLDIASSR